MILWVLQPRVPRTAGTGDQMMRQRLLLATAAVALTPAIMLGQQARVEFAGLGWTTPMDSVPRLLAARGYKLVNDERDVAGRWITLTGSLAGEEVRVSVTDAAGQVGKVSLYFEPERGFVFRLYERLKEQLTEKYGPPARAIEHFSSPYYKGDGYEEQAVRVGKGTFIVLWERPADGTTLGLTIQEDLSVVVVYEGPEWTAESKRRKVIRAKDF